jgi:EcsC protein family
MSRQFHAAVLTICRALQFSNCAGTSTSAPRHLFVAGSPPYAAAVIFDLAILDLFYRHRVPFRRSCHQKLAAQAVPRIGALGGAAVNYAFIDRFHEIARAHFTCVGWNDAMAKIPCAQSITSFPARQLPPAE